MLVVIRESMEHPEHVIFRGRTKVRLKAIDDILCGHTQGADFPSAGVLVGRTILEIGNSVDLEGIGLFSRASCQAKWSKQDRSCPRTSPVRMRIKKGISCRFSTR